MLSVGQIKFAQNVYEKMGWMGEWFLIAMILNMFKVTTFILINHDWKANPTCQISRFHILYPLMRHEILSIFLIILIWIMAISFISML